MATIAKVREEDPGQYLRICATIIPKDLDVRVDGNVDPDRLEAQLALLEAIIEERRAKDISAEIEVQTATTDTGPRQRRQ